MATALTVMDLLERGAAEAVAIGAPDRPGLTYAGLRSLVGSTVEALNGLGIGRNDRVAIVLPNGPEMATAFVTIACAATTAPLNPAYTADEFEFYLSDLKAKAIVLARDDKGPAFDVARKLDIPVIRLLPESKAAGAFQLLGESGGAGGPAAATGPAGSADIALVLHTSGTTSRPKIVPLSHENICTSAHNIRSTLRLGPEDRCLNIMPLFHIHGLVAAVLSSIAAGGSVVCTPGFNALKFFAWLDEARPSWYTAVPTMHQAILARTARNQEIVGRAGLRFIRSSSSALPPQVMRDLEEQFGCPVIESYGMTEASHQMASNPLPPGRRKPGSVGIAAGPEIAVMDEDGTLLPKGSTGEVVIRGPNVTRGYEGNKEANAAAFTNGWFRTGDQGVLDEDGYLTITGRLKEIINRGGEKISPREIDEALMDHPAVAQAVGFAMPHASLGEDVAAAVVLKEGETADERTLREFVAGRLADFKVPRRILVLDEIPKGATGKLQRIGLAARLGLTGE